MPVNMLTAARPRGRGADTLELASTWPSEAAIVSPPKAHSSMMLVRQILARHLGLSEAIWTRS